MSAQPLDPSVLVHVGYPKAASSFLQSTLFSGAHPQLGLVGMQTDATGPRYVRSGGSLFLGRDRGASGMAPFAFSADAARSAFLDSCDPSKAVTVI